MKKIKPEGKCHYCNKMYAGSSLSRHLNSHLKSIEQEKPSKKKSYHLKITGDGLYFLHLLIREEARLEKLDTYLRKIWLECCGHLSSFEIKGSRGAYSFNTDEFGINMKTQVGRILKKGVKLIYDYDFGSTTRLEISVVNEYFINVPKSILLLSRNEPLKLLCHLCNEKAAQVMCLLWHNKGTMFCHSCKKIHAKQCREFAEYTEVNIVNSPRTGICAYEGGSIDRKRDGVWQEEN